MNEPFHLHVTHQGQERELPARFERWGYTHRFAVLINEVTYLFEPDEEGSYRVLTERSDTIAAPVSLLQAVANQLVKLNSNKVDNFTLFESNK